MPDNSKRALLARDIALCLRQPLQSSSVNDASFADVGRGILLAGMALALLQPDLAKALELGELQVESAVGQPFSATTTARVGAGERLEPNCITSANPKNGMTYSKDLRVASPATSGPGNYPVTIRSNQPLYEPMYEIRLQVNCPGTVRLAKNYLVMLNLPLTSPVTRPQARATQARENPAADPVGRINPPAQTTGGRVTVATAPATRAEMPTNTGRLAPDSTALEPAVEYRVRQGDTLSGIASRISGRAAGSTWNVAEQIFALNPQAFIRNNPDLIKLGALITLPDKSMLQQASTAAPAAAPGNIPAPPAQPAVKVLMPAAEPQQDAVAANELSAPATQPIAEQQAVAESAAPETKPRAGAQLEEIQLESLPARLVGLTGGESQPETPAAAKGEASATAAPTTAGSSLLPSLAGLLIGLIVTALLFGRRLRRKFLPADDQSQTALTDGAELTDTLAGDAIDADPFAQLEEPEAEAEAEAEFEFESGLPTDAPSQDIAAGMTELEASAVDFDLGFQDDPEAASQDLTSLLDNDAYDQNLVDLTDGPRINLHAESTNDSPTVEAGTSNFAPDTGIEPAAKEFDAAGTMRNLFEELEPVADDAPTEELAPIADDAPTEEFAPIADDSPTQELGTLQDDAPTQELGTLTDDAPTQELATVSDNAVTEELPNLQSLAAGDVEGFTEDMASQTLSQALDLLSKDYEEELTNSQIMAAREVKEAFAAHNVDDD